MSASPNRTHAHALVAAALGIGVAALVSATVDSARLVVAGAGMLEATAAAGHAAVVIALGAGVLVMPVVWLAYLGATRRLVDSLPPSVAMRRALGLVAFSYGCYGVGVLQARLLSGAEVRVIAWAFGPPVVAAALWLIARPVQRALGGLWSSLDTRLRERPRALATALIALAALWIASFALLYPEVARAMKLARLWPLAAAVLTGLGCAMWLRPGRAHSVAALTLLAALGSGAATHMARPTSPQLLEHIDRHTHGARFALELTGRRVRVPIRQTVQSKGVGGQRGCYPDRPLPAVDSLGKAAESAPDVIFVTVDALRWDHTTMGSYRRNTTPKLARAVRHGAVFSRAFTPATSTRQTFRALFSGLHPSLIAPSKAGTGTGKWGLSFAKGQPAMAVYLREAGFETTAIIGDGYAFKKRNRGLRGFQTIDETTTKAQRRHMAALQVDRVISALSTPRVSPRFVWTHIMAPHQPYQRGPHPKRWRKPQKYDDRAMNQDRYDAAIHYVDGELSRLIDFVRGPTRRSRTLLIVAADHGQAFKEHGKRLHGQTVYNEESHVPLMVWGKGVKRRRIDTPVSLLDVFPTIFEAVGLPALDGACGQSLWPGLRGKGKQGPRDVYIEAVPDDVRDYFQAGLVRGHFKLVVKPQSGVRELYNLKMDRSESNDLAESEPERLRVMIEAMRTYHRERGMDASAYGL